MNAKQEFLKEILKEGEKYAGIILGTKCTKCNGTGYPGVSGKLNCRFCDGLGFTHDYHLILLPGQADDVNWKAAKEFASKAGEELPTRREQSLLFANLKEEFEERWYWSGELHASDSGYAWYQHFYYGNQSYSYLFSQARARCVRRLEVI